MRLLNYSLYSASRRYFIKKVESYTETWNWLCDWATRQGHQCTSLSICHSSVCYIFRRMQERGLAESFINLSYCSTHLTHDIRFNLIETCSHSSSFKECIFFKPEMALVWSRAENDVILWRFPECCKKWHQIAVLFTFLMTLQTSLYQREMSNICFNF